MEDLRHFLRVFWTALWSMAAVGAGAITIAVLACWVMAGCPV